MENETAKMLVETIVKQNKQILETSQKMYEKIIKMEATMVSKDECIENQRNCPRKGIPPYTALLAGIVLAVAGVIVGRVF